MSTLTIAGDKPERAVQPHHLGVGCKLWLSNLREDVPMLTIPCQRLTANCRENCHLLFPAFNHPVIVLELLPDESTGIVNIHFIQMTNQNMNPIPDTYVYRYEDVEHETAPSRTLRFYHTFILPLTEFQAPRLRDDTDIPTLARRFTKHSYRFMLRQLESQPAVTWVPTEELRNRLPSSAIPAQTITRRRIQPATPAPIAPPSPTTPWMDGMFKTKYHFEVLKDEDSD